MVALSGAHARLAFLLLLSIGFGARALIEIGVFILASVFATSLIPFTSAVLHCIPSLIVLTAYSLTASFFADVSCRSGGESSEVPYMTPFLVGANALMYCLFFVVASVTKVHHAHREFRLGSYFLLGISHGILAVIWCHFGFKLIVKLRARRDGASALADVPFTAATVSEDKSFVTMVTSHSKKFQTPYSDDPHGMMMDGGGGADFTICVTTHAGVTSLSPGDWSSPLASLGGYPPTRDSESVASSSSDLVAGLIKRLVIMSCTCPPLFLLNGFVEVYYALQLYSSIDKKEQSPEISDDFYSTFRVYSATLFAAQTLPPMIILASFWPAEMSWSKHPITSILWPSRARCSNENPRHRLRSFFGKDPPQYYNVPLLHDSS